MLGTTRCWPTPCGQGTEHLFGSVEAGLDTPEAFGPSVPECPGEGQNRHMTHDSSHQPDAPLNQDMPDGAVLVGLDGSEPATAALRWAAQEANFLGRPLHLIGAQEYVPMATPAEGKLAWSQYQALSGRETIRLLQSARQEIARTAPGVSVTASFPWGRPAQLLVEASERATVVVVGNRGRGRLTATVLGTVSLAVATHSKAPVVVVHSWTEEQVAAAATGPRRAVVGVDGSEDSWAAIRFALDHVGSDGRVHLIAAWWLEVIDGMVVTTPESPQWTEVTDRYEAVLREALREATGGEDDPRVVLRVERGHPAETLLAAADQPGDLIVVGTRGRGGFAGLVLGSVSQQVLTGATGPVAVLRGH